MRQANEREHTDHIRHQYVNPTLLFCNGFCLVCSAKVLVCNGFFWFVVPKFWFVMVLGVFSQNHYKPQKTTLNQKKPLRTELQTKTLALQTTGNHYKPKLWH